jgi:hypothetical protein
VNHGQHDRWRVNVARQSRSIDQAIVEFREGAFDQPAIERMAAAYEATLHLLRLTDRADPVCEIVAKKIIEIARAGERDPPKICARAIKELGIPLPD